MMTYEEAKALFATARTPASGKPLGNNTRLHLSRPGFGFEIWLHRTAVVTIHTDGTYTLSSGGWRTVTTKDRLNKYGPGRVFSDKGAWYYSPFGLTLDNSPWFRFFDGINIDGRDGMPLNMADAPQG